MANKFYILLCFLGFAITTKAQSNKESSNTFHLNVFISANKTIYVEEEKTSFQNVQKQVSEILRNQLTH